MTERHGYSSFRYYIPLKKEGDYVLILKFCELWHVEGGKRKFNIKFGDMRVAHEIDVAGTVGKYAALDEYIPFRYNAGMIFFKDNICKNALKDNKLSVEFEKTEYDNPFVHGIVLYEGTLADTD
jgi:hypothetical protein